MTKRLLILLLLLLALLLGVWLVRQRQLVSKKASGCFFCPSGSPSTTLGQTYSISLDIASPLQTPNNAGITGIRAVLSYPSNALSFTGISTLLPTPWSYTPPTVTSALGTSYLSIDAIFDQAGPTGYLTPGNMGNIHFASVNFITLAPGDHTLYLDSTQSHIYAKNANEDLLLNTQPSFVPLLFTVNPSVTITPTPTQTSLSKQISISNFAFSPQNFTITDGETVTWVNNDSVPHTVTFDVNTLFNSGNIAPGTSFYVTFFSPGTYTYHCELHPNMTGTVTVLPQPTGSLPPTSTTPTPTMSNAIPVVTVNTLLDNSPSGDSLCSLREAINNTNTFSDTTSGDCAPSFPTHSSTSTINFSVTGTIKLLSQLPEINYSVGIRGSDQQFDRTTKITLDGNNQYRILKIKIIDENNKVASASNINFINGHSNNDENGGAIFNEKGLLAINNSKFTNNYSSHNGGAISSVNGAVQLSDSSFENNTSYLAGGAISIEGSSSPAYNRITDSSFVGNKSLSSVGGAVYTIYGYSPSTSNGVTRIENSTFSSNTASLGGGAISTGTDSKTLIINSTLSGNSTTNNFGGGINNLGETKIVNSTLAYNTGQLASNIGNHNSLPSPWVNYPSAKIELLNTIVTQSSNSTIANCVGEITNITTNLQFGGPTANSCGTSIPNLDPKIEPLADNNHYFTQTHALLPSSPAIDSGTNRENNDGDIPSQDQRGVPRINQKDIGAYEYNTPPSSTPTATPTPTNFITITSPNGGETFTTGQNLHITWNASSSIDQVSLGYSTGPGSLNWIATNITGFTVQNKFYDWNISVGNTTNTQFKIYIIGYETGVGSVTDQSDNFFTILPAPTPTGPTPTSNPGIYIQVNFLVKFQGVTLGSYPYEIGKANVVLSDTTNPNRKLISNLTISPRNYNSQGKTDMFYIESLSDINFNQQITPGIYNLSIKGPSHLRKNFGDIEIKPGTGDTNLFDLTSTPLPVGDFGGNNQLDTKDFTDFISNWISEPTPVNSVNQTYDVNFDGKLSIYDISLVLAHWTSNIVYGDN